MYETYGSHAPVSLLSFERGQYAPNGQASTGKQENENKHKFVIVY